MTKVAKGTISKTTSFFLVLAGLFVVLFQKIPLRDGENSITQLLGAQTAHADFVAHSGGSLPNCQEGTCEGCSGCGDNACGADNGGCGENA
jgi:hypothetical protein